MNIHAVALVVSVVIFLFVIDLVRRHRLTFKYAVGWLLVSGGAIFFAVFYRLLFACAALLGFEPASSRQWTFTAVSCDQPARDPDASISVRLPSGRPVCLSLEVL